MKKFSKRPMIVFMLVVAMLMTLVIATPVSAGRNTNPGVIPNKGHLYETLSASWWQWAYGFSAAEVPFFNTGGPVDASAGQSGHVWFLAGANSGLTEPRTIEIPTGTSLFFPLANLVNDFPCPDPTFQPNPGETLEQFLQRTGNEFLDFFLPDSSQLFAELNGISLTNLSDYRATSDLFIFTADPALAATFDACITGTPQPGVAVGYWLLLTPLPPGDLTLHCGAGGLFNQDVTELITVKPGR